MSDYSFKRMLQEQFEDALEKVLSSPSPMRWMYYGTMFEQAGGDQGLKLAPNVPPGPIMGKRPSKPNLTIRPVESGGVIVDDNGTQDSEGVPVQVLPQWLIDWFTANGLYPLPAGYQVNLVEIEIGGNLIKIYRVIGPDGAIAQQYIYMNGQVQPIPGNWQFLMFDDMGIPLFSVPAGNGMPAHIAHGGGLYIEFLPGNPPQYLGVPYVVRRLANGQWVADPDGDGVYDDGAWVPDEPSDWNAPEGGLAGWWDRQPAWFQAVLIAAAVAGAIWLGAELLDWLENNEHQNTESGGPPVPPSDPPEEPPGDDVDDGGDDTGGGDPPGGDDTGGGDPPGGGGGPGGPGGPG